MKNIFVDNRYTALYFKIINRAISENRKRNKIFVNMHHIVPRSVGGTNAKDNLVLLSYKEHRVCHVLLIKMFDNQHYQIKMRHAYGFFNKSSAFNGPRYKRGTENIFSTEPIKEMVKERMINDNPMKSELQKERMRLKNPNSKQIEINGIVYESMTKTCSALKISIKELHLMIKNSKAKIVKHPLFNRKCFVSKKTFVTPKGEFSTAKELIQTKILAEWMIGVIFSNLDSLPLSNGRRSKFIENNYDIDYNKTWRENGFDLRKLK